MLSLKLITVPIGNIQDITERAKNSFIQGNLIFAEDTRNTKKLFKFLNIDTSMKEFFSFHEHSNQDIEKYVRMIQDKDAIFVSDAGSPILSDPAYPLIKACLKCDIEIISNPGVSSVVTALELSGLPSNTFYLSWVST